MDLRGYMDQERQSGARYPDPVPRKVDSVGTGQWASNEALHRAGHICETMVIALFITELRDC